MPTWHICGFWGIQTWVLPFGRQTVQPMDPSPQSLVSSFKNACYAGRPVFQPFETFSDASCDVFEAAAYVTLFCFHITASVRASISPIAEPAHGA